MNLGHALRQWRNWFPIPNAKGKFGFARWMPLEAKRLAVTGALLTFVFISFLSLGFVWTFEMQSLLTGPPQSRRSLTRY